MALANYADLLASLAGWSNRTDIAPIFPDFVALAEARISRDLRTRRMVATTTVLTVANTQSVTMPADWLETENLSVLSDPPSTLNVVTPEFMDQRYPAGYQTGKPAVYCLVGNNMQLGPTPDAVYSISIDYYAKIPALSVTPTNWLMTGHPGIYLAGAMAELSLYLQDDQRITIWDQKYRSEVATLQDSDDQAIRSGSSMRVRYF